MANKFSLLTITTLLPIGAIAQAPTDSVAHEQTLQEVVVLAPTMERMDNYILVRPDANQRRHSGNAYELLRNCFIPGVVVDMQTGDVEAIGAKLQLFCHFRPICHPF